MNAHPKAGVTVIIQRSMCGGWFVDGYGPTGAALTHQSRIIHPNIELALSAAHQLYGDALERVTAWSPENGYQEVDA
jgi:hypothetical protein